MAVTVVSAVACVELYYGDTGSPSTFGVISQTTTGVFSRASHYLTDHVSALYMLICNRNDLFENTNCFPMQYSVRRNFNFNPPYQKSNLSRVM